METKSRQMYADVRLWLQSKGCCENLLGIAHWESEGPLYESLIDPPFEPYNFSMKENFFVFLHICLCVIWVATVISVIYWFSQ